MHTLDYSANFKREQINWSTVSSDLFLILNTVADRAASSQESSVEENCVIWSKAPEQQIKYLIIV